MSFCPKFLKFFGHFKQIPEKISNPQGRASFTSIQRPLRSTPKTATQHPPLRLYRVWVSPHYFTAKSVPCTARHRAPRYILCEAGYFTATD